MIIGRTEELALLESALADARGAVARRIAVIGEPGIGKTTLLEAIREAAADMRVLSARGVESEAELPFGGLLDLLHPLADLIDALGGSLARALRCALGLEEGDAGDRFAVGAATLGLLAAAAEESPLLVLIDDLQWVDPPSREAMLFAVRRLDADRVAVVAALRDDGSVGDGELTGLERLVVSGLGLDAVAALVGRPRAEAALMLTGGNPLALLHIDAEADLELVPTPIPLPRRLLDVYRKSIEGLPDECRTALLVAAADDVGAVATIARALGPEGDGLREIGPAEEAELIALRDGRVEFTHPLARSAVYHHAAPAQRRAAHTALARVYASRSDEMRAAWHLAAAAVGPDEAAAAGLDRLAKVVSRRAAYATASRALQRAAALSPTDEDAARRVLAAASAAWSAGDTTTAVELASRARDLTRDPDVRGQAANLWGRVTTTTGGDSGEICEVLERDAEDLFATRPATAGLLLAQAADRAFFGSGDVDLSQRLAQRASETAGAAGSSHPRVLQAHAWHMIRTGQGQAGVNLMQTAIEETLAARSDDPAGLLEAVYMEIWAGDLPAALRLSRSAERAAREHADIGQLPEILGCLGEMRMRCDGDWNAGTSNMQEAVRLAEETGQPATAAYVRASYAEFCAYRGNTEEVEWALAPVEPFRRNRVWCDMGATTARVLLALTCTGSDAALPTFPPAARTFDTWWGFATDRIEALVRRGRLEEAEAEIEDAASFMTMPLSAARLDRCRGLIAPGDAYTEPLDRSIAALTALGLDFERARSQLCLGERLRRSGLRVAARKQLRAALQVFDRASCRPWTEQASRELTASGARRRQLEGVDDELTPQERQIAQLVAEGRTNREVATLVFLSPKTIEAHLGRVYRKLGVSSRTEIPHDLAQQPTPDHENRHP